LLFFPLLFLFGCPLLTDPNVSAKAYLFFFFTIFNLLLIARHFDSIQIPVVAFWWMGLTFAFLLSVFYSADSASALILCVYMLAAGAFLVVVRNQFLADKSFVVHAVWALALVAVLYAVLGLYQYHDFLLHGKRSSMLIPSFLPSTGARVNGPFGQPNFQATVMLIGLCCVAYLYRLRGLLSGTIVRWGLGLVVVVLWLNFFLANSRAGYLSLICCFVLLYIYARYRFRSHRELVFSVKEVGVTFLLLVLAWGIYWLLVNVVALLIDPAVEQQEFLRGGSIYNRINMWVAAVLMTVDYPLLGVGLDNYKNLLAEYQIEAHGLTRFYYEDLIYTRWAHNEYLQILAEGGIVAFVAMTGFLIAAGRGIWHNLKNTTTPSIVFIPLALVPLLVHGGFEWPLRSPHLLASFLLLIAISLPVVNKDYAFSLVKPLHKGTVCAVCLILIGLGTWALYWDMEAGILKRHTGEETLLSHNLERLEVLADNPVTALTILRQGILPYLNYTIREQDVELARFLVPIFERIIHLEGASWQWHNLALLQLAAGYLDASRTSVEKAIYLNPIYEPSWQLQRHLNMLNAVEQTGRPIESFLPPDNSQMPEFDALASPE